MYIHSILTVILRKKEKKRKKVFIECMGQTYTDKNIYMSQYPRHLQSDTYDIQVRVHETHIQIRIYIHSMNS